MSRIQEFNYSVDLLKFIFWQYDQPVDKNISKLIRDKQGAINTLHTDFWNNWFNDVFNLDTCNDFGISVWAFILDLPLVNDSPLPSKTGWGVENTHKNFNNGNFNQNPEGVALLTIEQKRTTLKLRYHRLTTRGTVPEINRILIEAFGSLGTVYVEDNLDMTITYKFDFPLPEWVEFIAETFDVLPTPQGVKYNLVGT